MSNPTQTTHTPTTITPDQITYCLRAGKFVTQDVIIGGVRKTLGDWCRQTKVPAKTFKRRIRSGKTIHAAMHEPTNHGMARPQNKIMAQRVFLASWQIRRARKAMVSASISTAGRPPQAGHRRQAPAYDGNTDHLRNHDLRPPMKPNEEMIRLGKIRRDVERRLENLELRDECGEVWSCL